MDISDALSERDKVKFTVHTKVKPGFVHATVLNYVQKRVCLNCLLKQSVTQSRGNEKVELSHVYETV